MVNAPGVVTTIQGISVLNDGIKWLSAFMRQLQYPSLNCQFCPRRMKFRAEISLCQPWLEYHMMYSYCSSGICTFAFQGPGSAYSVRRAFLLLLLPLGATCCSPVPSPSAKGVFGLRSVGLTSEKASMAAISTSLVTLAQGSEPSAFIVKPSLKMSSAAMLPSPPSPMSDLSAEGCFFRTSAASTAGEGWS